MKMEWQNYVKGPRNQNWMKRLTLLALEIKTKEMEQSNKTEIEANVNYLRGSITKVRVPY